MDIPSDYYHDVVAVYIRLIQQDSPEAAAAILMLQAACGSRAALRAALALTLLKMEVQQRVAPDARIYAYMFADYPDALPFLARAVKCWLHDRNIRDAEFGIRQNGNLRETDAQTSIPTTELPPALEG